jgi:hypothetical protein
VQLVFAVPALHDNPSVLDHTVPPVLLGATMTNLKLPLEAVPVAIEVSDWLAAIPVTLAFDQVRPSEL